MFKRVLVANRGEIALRIIRTLKEMGIETVAIHSEADTNAAHVLCADQAHLIGPAQPQESYLNIERIIDIAKKTRSDAIHPGYGFLAENPSFAKACEDEGITFIGPPSDVIAKLGDKIVSRKMARQAGVPVIPGMLEATKDMEKLKESAKALNFPLIVKAALGGGGKGMRVVHDPSQLEEACVSAMREAEMAFGDGRIYLESFLYKPRHVEFQILADKAGDVIHLFERECSIQRRHQKLLEETPSPALFPELREEMGKAAVRLAKAAGYVNAGTVEFLLGPSGDFYFLEVNTRIQVEHPITEMTLGVDLVRHQVLIAWGIPLRLKQHELKQRGHSIQCRIYAEDPERAFMPSPGKITGYKEPSGPGVRVDSGVYEGSDVPLEYDPILSKVIVWAEDREGARRRMLRALQEYFVSGVKTTIPLLVDLLLSMPFIKGETHIGLLEEGFSSWKIPKTYSHIAAIGAAISELTEKRFLPSTQNERPSPWQTIGSWEL